MNNLNSLEPCLGITEQQKQLHQIVLCAIEQFNANESDLVLRDLSERCICAKFAQYLYREVNATGLVGYKVDVEFNRGRAGDEYALKHLDDGKLMVADLIVHKRGESANYMLDNLICIEMKKSKKISRI